MTESPCSSPAVDIDAVVSALAMSAPRWLDAVDPGDCVVRGVERRQQSVLIWARLTSGAAFADVVVKIPRAPSGASGRGRLFDPVGDPLRKAALEYRTISVVAQRLDEAADARLGWVEPIGFLPDLGALVIGELTSPTLDQMLRGRVECSAVGLNEIMSNVGAWLAAFQSFETPHMVARDTTPSQVAESVADLIGAVRDAGRGARLPDAIDPVVARFESRVDSSALRTGLGHGDLAPRNVFVDDDGRVTVIDSLGRFSVPVYEDLAYLLVELSTGANRFVRRGLPRTRRQLAELRSAFLSGHGTTDDAVLWFFELRALIDKWRSLAQRPQAAGQPVRTRVIASSTRELLIARRVHSITDRLGDAW